MKNSRSSKPPKESKGKEGVDKPSKRKIKRKEPDPETLSYSDLLDVLGKSVPADQETDEMLSETILQLADPFIKKYDKEDLRVKSIIGLAVASWNLTAIPQKYWESAIKEITNHLPKDFTVNQIESLLLVLFDMVQRKLQSFQNTTLFIEKYEILQAEGHWKLKVLSFIEVKEKPDLDLN